MRMTDQMIEALDLQNSFVPPYPERPTEHFAGLTGLRRARQNILSIFTERDFKTRQISGRFMRANFYVCNNPDGVRSTLTAQHAVFERKTPQQRFLLEPLLGDGLFVSDGKTWRERRAIVAPIVHGRHMPTFAPIMRETVVEWCAQWHAAGQGATLNILAEMGELTAEIISRTVFGRRLGRRYTNEIVSSFAEYQRETNATDLPSLIGLPDWFPRVISPKARAAAKRLHKALDEIIDACEAAAGEDPDGAIIHGLFAGKGRDGEKLSRDAIRNEAIVIFMAGHETTANTLAWAIYLVSQSPRVRQKLQEEFARVLGGRVPDLEDVPDLTYTRAVIEETLRLYPPVPILGRVATGEGTCNGIDLHDGDFLVVAPWLLHRNKDVWSLPDHFVPERFDRSYDHLSDKFSYIPFASGPRVCPGLTFAMTESVLCIATLLQTFDVTLIPGHRVAVECRMTLRPGHALPMRVRWRPQPAPRGRSATAINYEDIPWEATLAPEPPAPPLSALTAKGPEGIAARRYHISDRVLGGLKMSLNRAFRALPPAAPGAFAANVIAPIVRRRRSKLADRLNRTVATLKPELSPSEREELVARWFSNVARAMAAFANVETLTKPPYTTHIGTQHLDAGRAMGRPIIMTGVHTGCWEMAAVHGWRDLRHRGTGPHQPQRSRFDNRIIAATRRRMGIKCLTPGPGLSRTLLRFLEAPENGIVLLVDEVSDGQIKFPQFGRAWPSRCNANFVVKTAVKTGATIIPVTLASTIGAQSTVQYHAPFTVTRDTEREAQQALNTLYEAHILSHLDQWYMLHTLKL